MEQIAKLIANYPTADLVRFKVYALMHGYDQRWRSSSYRAISLEEEFHLPIVNPDTGRQSRSWTQAGKYDGIVEMDGRRYLLEHKSTSDDIRDPDATYWRQLAVDSQVSMYALANWQAERKLEGTVYDVIKKPTIRPKKLTQMEKRTIASLGQYCGQKVHEETQQQITGGEERETPDLFGIRLAADIAEDPNKYFQRRMVPRLDHELVEWATELWQSAKQISEARRSGVHPRNSDACMQYGRPCDFLGICSGHDTPESDRWQRVDSVHRELDTIDSGTNILTHSRLRSFRSCHRKHYYRYELGLERVEQEDPENLVMGRLLHESLELWWASRMKGSDNGDSNTVNGAVRRPSDKTQLPGARTN